MNRKISKQNIFKGPWDIRGKQLWNKSINGESTLRIKQASKPPPLKKKKTGKTFVEQDWKRTSS